MSSDRSYPQHLPPFEELMQQAQRMQEELLQSQSRLAQEKVEASSGGGMVTVTMSGTKELLSLQLDPQVIDPKDPMMLQDLIIAAVNQALQKVRQLEEETMHHAASGLGLPIGM